MRKDLHGGVAGLSLFMAVGFAGYGMASEETIYGSLAAFSAMLFFFSVLMLSKK